MPAPKDIDGALVDAHFAGGTPRTEFVEYSIPGVGRARVAYSVFPGQRPLIRIQYQRPDGTPVTKSFDNLSDYAKEWGRRTIFADKDFVDKIEQQILDDINR